MKSFLNLSDLSKINFLKIIENKEIYSNLKNKNIGLLFEKNSTRTRLSFSVAINNLKGNCLDIKLEDLNLMRGESLEDTFRTMNCYLDGLIYRTNNHKKLLIADKYFEKPIINAAKINNIEYSSLIFELGNRKLVAGQEDLILEIASKLKN